MQEKQLERKNGNGVFGNSEMSFSYHVQISSRYCSIQIWRPRKKTRRWQCRGLKVISMEIVFEAEKLKEVI